MVSGTTAPPIASPAGAEESSPDLNDFASEELLELDPLPCWAAEGLSKTDIRRRVAEMVDTIIRDAAAEHQAAGTRPSSPEVFRRVHPHERPKTTKRSPAPLVHAATREVRQLFREAYAIFLEAYQDAAALLRTGASRVKFPEGSFPPGLPFVPIPESG